MNTLFEWRMTPRASVVEKNSWSTPTSWVAPVTCGIVKCSLERSGRDGVWRGETGDLRLPPTDFLLDG